MEIIKEKTLKTLHSLVPVHTVNEQLFVGARLEEEIVERSHDFLASLQISSREYPTETFHQLIKRMERKYNVKVEYEIPKEPENLRYFHCKPKLSKTIYLTVLAV